MKFIISNELRSVFISGSQAEQHRRPIRLHSEDSRLRTGEIGRNVLHDDALRRHQVLPSAGSHPGHGLQGERGHLVGGMHHGRNDSRRCPLSGN